MQLATLIDHDRCPPDRHRTTALTAIGETADAAGRLVCNLCGGPMYFCADTAAANRVNSGWERTYLHTNPHHEETCR